jgi:glutamyl-tRNA synthetase
LWLGEPALPKKTTLEEQNMAALAPVRVRFAPSPTGRLHLGGGRTALYDFLMARQSGGQFILRLEDTDTRRYVPGAEQEIIDGLHWLGLDWDEGFDIGGAYGPYRQSQRRDQYALYTRQLLAGGHAYPCFCSTERLDKLRQEQQQKKLPLRYDGTCRNLDPDEAARRVASGEKYVVRFKMPYEGSITVTDHLRGEITVENSNLDDSILVRTDGLPVYHLASMADDFDMKITHVVRGSEWLPSFPLHAHVIRALGWPMPEFIHLSLFLKPSGKGKLSKRDSAELMKDGYSVFLTDLKNLGYVPEAVVNWMSLMGWSYDDHTEIFSLSDLVEKFSIDKLNPAPAAINFTKLDHFNGVHIRSLPLGELANRIKPFFLQAGYAVDDALLLRIAPLIQERLGGLDEAPAMAGFFFQEEVEPEPQALVGKNLTPQASAEAARRALAVLEGLPELSHAEAEPRLRELVEVLGLSAGQLFSILRVAVTGQTVSPPLFESMEIVGAQKVLQRLRRAITMLESLE